MSSPSTSPEAIKIGRKRASTKTLLGKEWQETVDSAQEAPEPPTPSSSLNQQKLRRGLMYADLLLRNTNRKLSPIGARALKMYKDACTAILDLELQISDLEEGEIIEEDEEKVQALKVRWAATIRIYEKSIQYHACLHSTSTSSAQELQDRLVELLQTTFYAQYGDMFTEACRVVTTTAEAKKVDDWNALCKTYWTDISQRLVAENDDYKQLLRIGKNHDRCPLHITIQHACVAVGFNLNDMLAIIKHYAIRNELMHANLLSLVKQGKPYILAKMLHDDFCDLPNIVPASQVAELQLMQQLVDAIINLSFKKKGEEDNYERWVPTEILEALMDDLPTVNGADEVARWKKATEDITKALRKRLHDQEQSKGLVETFDKNFDLLTGSLSQKRVASVELDKEIAREKKRRKQWHKVVNLMENTRKMRNSYVSEWGEMTPPPQVVHDPRLD
ncbi:hypothetical protein MMC18_000406 [Xylographa bjoerkii]|nr:hypothetical protein [Xylographa bjoerkii]